MLSSFGNSPLLLANIMIDQWKDSYGTLFIVFPLILFNLMAFFVNSFMCDRVQYQIILPAL